MERFFFEFVFPLCAKSYSGNGIRLNESVRYFVRDFEFSRDCVECDRETLCKFFHNGEKKLNTQKPLGSPFDNDRYF